MLLTQKIPKRGNEDFINSSKGVRYADSDTMCQDHKAKIGCEARDFQLVLQPGSSDDQKLGIILIFYCITLLLHTRNMSFLVKEKLPESSPIHTNPMIFPNVNTHYGQELLVRPSSL